jgi:hypothetical protein
MANFDDYPYEQFPHAELQIGTPRRKFLSAIMAELHIQNHKSSGHVGRKLTDLGLWADEDLYCVIPLLIPGSKVELKDHFVSVIPDGRPALMLFSTDSPALVVFNLFNGENSLIEIADTLAAHTGWAAEKAFAYTRGVFLSLVMVGLCQPKW